MERNVNQTSRSDSHKNTLTNNFFNVRHKIVNTVEYGCDQYYEQDISSELKKLKVNDPWSKEVFKNNLNIFLDKTKHIPEKVLFNIVKILKIYKVGVFIDNFIFIYNVSLYFFL